MIYRQYLLVYREGTIVGSRNHGWRIFGTCRLSNSAEENGETAFAPCIERTWVDGLGRLVIAEGWIYARGRRRCKVLCREVVHSTQYTVHPNVGRIRTRQAEISLHHAKLHEPGRPGIFEKFASSAGFQIPTNDHGLRVRNSTVLVHWSVGL